MIDPFTLNILFSIVQLSLVVIGSFICSFSLGLGIAVLKANPITWDRLHAKKKQGYRITDRDIRDLFEGR